MPVRKKGKLPWRCIEAAYALEYGEAVVEIHENAVRQGENILLVDDLLATGAAVKLLEGLGAEILSRHAFRCLEEG